MFDPNAIASDFFSKIAASASSKLFNTAEATTKKIIEEMRTNFAEYVNNTFHRYSKVITLLNRDESIRINEIYVKTKFKKASRKEDDALVIKEILACERLCIIGSGGCGKSMFMRHALMNMLENDSGKIPIFVELRNMNTLERKNIMNLIHYTVNGSDGNISVDHFSSLMSRGSFVVMLDGFDEIHIDHRTEVEKQIIEMSFKYKDVGFVVSSRDDHRFLSWIEYKVYHVLPMEKAEVISLIGKLKYDSGVKKKFSDNIKSGLYEKHRSFLSNPLLATMMLLTYDQFSQIPDKIHLFYEQAFETLYFRHDSSKEAGYVRKMRTKLPINNFKDCISSMCIATYMREKYTFNESEILEFIEKALTIEKFSEKPVDFLGDLLESVCIMQRDGLYIAFTHRSFQEYFSAHFISRSPSKSLAHLLDHLVRRPQDNAVGMAYDMNSSLLEREWLKPKLRRLIDVLSKLDPKTQQKEILKTIYVSVRIEYDATNRRFFYFVRDKTEYTDFVIFLQKVFAGYFVKIDKPIQGLPKDNLSITNEFRRQKKFPKVRLPIRRRATYEEISIVVNFDDCEWMNDGDLLKYAPGFMSALKEIYDRISDNVTKKEAMVMDLFVESGLDLNP